MPWYPNPCMKVSHIPWCKLIRLHQGYVYLPQNTQLFDLHAADCLHTFILGDYFLYRYFIKSISTFLMKFHWSAAQNLNVKWFVFNRREASSYFSWPSIHCHKSGVEAGRINSIHPNLSTVHAQQSGSEFNLQRRTVWRQQKATHWATRTYIKGEFLQGLWVLALLKCLLLTENFFS